MNLFGQWLDERDERRDEQDAADDLWLRERGGIEPEERRAAWRRWLRRTLETSLQWPEQAEARAKLIGQCMAELTTLARQLRGRGWLLEGRALAEHVRAVLEPIGKAQRAGKVEDFWPYFRAAVRRYVGTHAEEIQAHARQTGADAGAQTMADALAAFGLGKAAKRGPSMTEVVATRGDELAAAKAAREAADRAQLPLL